MGPPCLFPRGRGFRGDNPSFYLYRTTQTLITEIYASKLKLKNVILFLKQRLIGKATNQQDEKICTLGENMKVKELLCVISTPLRIVYFLDPLFRSLKNSGFEQVSCVCGRIKELAFWRKM